MLVFEERGNWCTRRKPLGAEKRTNKLNPHITPESNPGHIGGRRVLSPLRHPCTPKWKCEHLISNIQECCQPCYDKKQNKAEPSYRPGAHFLKVPKLFGGISSDIILFVSSKQSHLEAQNLAVILIFIPFTTYEKTSFTEQVGCSFANSFFDPKRFCNFQEMRLWTLNNCHCQPV